jgi:methionyl-tRNA formyltransferase
MQHRIVVLCGPKVTHKHTCATLIRHGLNVVGICIADQRSAGLPLKYIRRDVERKGAAVTLSRVMARFLYAIQNSRADRKIFASLFDEQAIESALHGWKGPIHRTADYSAPETLAWLKDQAPDVIVAHTPYWVGKVVRNIPKTKIVLGGHPGVTPHYRGSHSAFWALYRGKPEDVGCTVFTLDDGVDTGDIVAQCRLSIDRGDSFITLGWKGMIQVAEMQALVLRNLDAGVDLPRRRIESLPERSAFDNPTLAEYLTYRSRQRLAR